MKKFLMGTVGLVALGMAPASAADLAARPYVKAPPIAVALYDWSGFYIGANGGYGSSRNCWDYRGTIAAPAIGGPEGCHDATGGVAGGQIGYNWQAGSWVFGLEAQGDWADLAGSNVSVLFPGATNRSKIDSFGLFTGRVGYAWNAAMLYVKGGAAVTHNTYDYRANGAPVPFSSVSDTRWGGTVGVGLEWGFAPNWSAAVEYDHLFMGNRDLTFALPSTTIDNIRQDVDLVTVRVNYRWGGPVVAKY